MLRKRVLSAVLFLPVFYCVAWMLPSVYFMIMATVAAAIGLHEFYRMARARGAHPNRTMGIALGVLLIVWFYRAPLFGPDIGGLLAASLLLILSGRLFSPRPVEGALEDAAATFTGVVYVALLFSYQVGVRIGMDGRAWLVFLYLTIWASDIGAYAVGMNFGRHRLYEKVSPKKSVEGLVGALAASAGTALICRAWFMPPIGAWEAAALGAVLAAVGTIGDLAESLLKRSSGIKDSGDVIPGHGGMLDRMDSMLFAAPALYYYLQLR
jgi:phosphatidate cytidylyltransferase